MGGNLQLDQLRGEMKRSSPQSIAENTEEMKEWEDELERLQKLVPIQASRDRLKRNELPALEKQIKEQEAAIPAISKKAEEVRWFAVHFVVSL
jgi:DNA repair protein RAD50